MTKNNNNKRTQQKKKQGKRAATSREMTAISQPISRGVIMRFAEPKMTHRGSSVVISHSEELTSVGTSSTVNAYVDAVLPIIPTSFPWLGNVALSYSNFKFTKIRFSYVTRTATTTNGFQGMAFIYDPADGPITSTSMLSTLSGAVISPVWAGGQGYGVKGRESDVTTSPDSRRMRVVRKVRGITAFNALSNSDKLLFCNAWLVTATGGSTSTSTTVGAIFAHYECELSEPIAASINN